jgi:putative ABC transport system permease protein
MIARSLAPTHAATITYWNLALAFGMVLLIAVVSGYIGVREGLRKSAGGETAGP